MSDVSGIPNLGIPGMGGFNPGNFFASPSAGLDNAAASQAMANRYFQNQASTLGAANSFNPFANSGGSFGAQPAHYAGVGAAYGRATGGFKPPAGGGGGSVFDTGTAPVPYQDAPGPGSFSPSPNYPGGRGSSVFDTGTSAVPSSPPMGSFSPSPNYPGGSRNEIAQAMMPTAPNFNDTFSQLGMRGNQMQNQPAIDAVNTFSRGGRFNPSVPPSAPPSPAELGTPSTGGPTPGWTPDFGGIPSGGAGSPGSFADRFAFRNAGTPSEYTTSPYTSAGGQTFQPNIPPGYQTPFSADNPSGALTRQMRAGAGAPPVMNSSSGEDTLTAQDANIPFGPRGSFDPSAFSPSQYQPSSPFGSGQGVGGLRGGSGGLGTGTGTQMPPTQLPFFGGGGSGFGAPGSTQNGGLYAGRGNYPALVGAPNDAYGNPFIQGNSPPHARGATPMGGGIGLGGLDALGQGSVFRGVR